ncbi:MAG: hypothetical protein KDB80_11520, partial [Planctomycetes bacterium]|nr:hypothetical protein [Planctomycetota bacterium]
VAELWVRLAALVSESPDELADAMVAAFAAAPDSDRVRAAATNYFSHDQLSVEAVRAAGTTDAIEPRDLETLLALLHRESAEPVAWVPVLEANLELAIERCRAAGSHVLLGDYPFLDPALDEAVRRVAERTGVELVSIHARFPQDRARHAALFVADGHCNDAGYRIVAQAFADAIERLVR